MLLSIATAQWKVRDAKQEIYDLVDQLNSIGEKFAFNKDYVLKACLVLTDVADIQFRVNNFNKENMSRIEAKWDAISDSLRLTVQAISSWGYNWQTLPSNYATIPLAYYLFKKENPQGFVASSKFEKDREGVKHWLRIALLKRIFSGTPDNVLRQIRRVMQGEGVTDGFPADEIRNELAPTPRSMKFDQAELEGLLSYRYNQAYTFIVLSMIYPWLIYDQRFHIDHIFPKAHFNKNELRKRGIPERDWSLWLDQVNNLGNLQLLQGSENIEKSSTEFEKWLVGKYSDPTSINMFKKNHFIPEVDLSFDNFPNFIKAREELLRTRLARILNVTIVNGKTTVY